MHYFGGEQTFVHCVYSMIFILNGNCYICPHIDCRSTSITVYIQAANVATSSCSQRENSDHRDSSTWCGDDVKTSSDSCSACTYQRANKSADCVERRAAKLRRKREALWAGRIQYYACGAISCSLPEYCSAEPASRNCLLEKWAVAAYWICTPEYRQRGGEDTLMLSVPGPRLKTISTNNTARPRFQASHWSRWDLDQSDARLYTINHNELCPLYYGSTLKNDYYYFMLYYTYFIRIIFQRIQN